MRDGLQAQIDSLKTNLAAKNAQIAALQAKMKTTEESAGAIAAQVHENAATVTSFQTSVSATQAATSTGAVEIAAVRKTEETVKKEVEEPRSIRYKGIEFIPGGFVAGESIWRQRAMNADIYTNFNATPYMNAGEAHTSEWVPSARQSRLSSWPAAKFRSEPSAATSRETFSLRESPLTICRATAIRCACVRRGPKPPSDTRSSRRDKCGPC